MSTATEPVTGYDRGSRADAQQAVPPTRAGGPPVAQASATDSIVERAAKTAGWVVVALAGVALVLYALSPLFQERDQHRLLHSYQSAVRESSLESSGLEGIQLPTQPPATGATVGILEVGRIRLQQVVSEGVGPVQTERGPGHVPGTAGLGQPGNAAVVGRRGMFGGPFSDLSSLRRGDRIVVTTTEGQSVYVVRQETTTTLLSGAGPAATTPTLGAKASSGPLAPAHIGRSVAVDDLYGPSTDNRLTLVTAGSSVPWDHTRATVVIARLEGLPFVPTPQQARSAGEEGRTGASGAWAPLILVLVIFALVAAASMTLYRRITLRSAYLITTAPLIVATVELAVTVSRLLPAWA